MATKKYYTEEQLNAFARAPPPKNYEEAMKREDALGLGLAACLTCCARHKVLTVPGAASPRENNIVGNIVK